MEKKKSISKILLSVQVVVFALVCIFVLVDSILLCYWTIGSMSKEKELQVKADIIEVESRLEAVQLQLREIVVSVYNANGLWSDDNGEKYFDKVKMAGILSDKVAVHRDLELCFIFKEDEFMLNDGSLTLPISDRIEIRRYIEENVEQLVTDLNENNWVIRNVYGEYYCFLVYYMKDSDIYMGSAIRLEQLFKNIIINLHSMEGNFEIQDGRDGSYEFAYQNEIDNTFGHFELKSQSIGNNMQLFGHFRINFFDLIRNNMIILIIFIGSMCIVSVIIQNLMINKVVIEPLEQLSSDVEKAQSDIYQVVVAENANTKEFFMLQKTLNYLLKETISARILSYERQLQEQDMKLKQLRAQLRPHFYLNAIMTVSSMTHQNRNEDIREYLNKLSFHMRYIMQISTEMVTLGKELDHIDNYLKMQELKFPSSVILMTDCSDELKDSKIPHLIIDTVVENAFKYAMNLSDIMILMIKCEKFETRDFSGYRVIIEDNGKGFSQNVIEYYNGGAVFTDTDENHIGLSNIKRSLAIRYGKEDLLLLSNVIPHGAKVEIRIPE